MTDYSRIAASLETRLTELTGRAEAIEADLRARYPAVGDRFITVMNGADPEISSSRPLSQRFTITHAGGLYNGRDPRSLLNGFRGAIGEEEVFAPLPAPVLRLHRSLKQVFDPAGILNRGRMYCGL